MVAIGAELEDFRSIIFGLANPMGAKTKNACRELNVKTNIKEIYERLNTNSVSLGKGYAGYRKAEFDFIRWGKTYQARAIKRDFRSQWPYVVLAKPYGPPSWTAHPPGDLLEGLEHHGFSCDGQIDILSGSTNIPKSSPERGKVDRAP